MPDDPIDPATLMQSQPPQMDAPAAPYLAGSPGSPTAEKQAKQPPRLGRPALLDFITSMVKPQMIAPGPGQTARPASRMGAFEDFLGNFVFSLGQGMQAAHGPGAFGKGFGAAAAAPYGQAVQQWQMGQQQQAQEASIQQEQAHTGLMQEQARVAGTMATLPDGTQVPISALGNYYKGAAAAGISGQTRITAEKLKILAMTGQIGSVQTDAEGNKVAYNKFGKPIGQLEGAVDPGTFLKSTSTIEYKEDENGNIIALPKTSTSGVILPGKTAAPGAPTAAPSGFPKPSGGGTANEPRIVGRGKSVGMVVGTHSSGKQVSGTPSELRAAGVNAFTKLDAGEAAKVNTARQLTSPGGLFDLATKDLEQFKPGELEGLAPRWNEFLAGSSIFNADPRYIRLRTHVNGLLGTAMMQAHVGAKGGEAMMEHFEDIANAGKMSRDSLQTALDAEKQYVEEKAMRPPVGGSTRFRANGRMFNIPPSQRAEFLKDFPSATEVK